MDIQERFELIKQVGEEILTEEDILELLKTKKEIIAYDGFEPSGKVHIAQGLMRTININKMIKTEFDERAEIDLQSGKYLKFGRDHNIPALQVICLWN